jgi:hypothetical protein
MDWPKIKYIYSHKDLLYFVINACTKALAIPSHKMTRFLAQNITVTDLWAFDALGGMSKR